jgi:BirA family biotin operon repressor/biotin-[acetyl-CoA-carboxylase] ligase
MQIIKLNSTDSTNSYLKRLMLERTLEDFSVVVANNQTNGRGQRGSVWLSDKGKNLTFSVLKINPSTGPRNQFMLNILVSLSIVKALESFNVPKLSIKWPNDIFVNDKKIAGVLIENSIREKKLQKSIVGIGINANNNCSDIESATSLKEVLNADIGMKELLSSLCQELEKYYLLFRNDKNQIQDLYHSYLYKKDCLVNFTKEDYQFSAIVKEVDDFGRLILIEKGVEKAYSVGELSFNLF